MNPAPSLQGALWPGNQQLATKTQLLSSISGVYADIQDISGFIFEDLTISTLTVQKWISVPQLYVSSLFAPDVFSLNDVSGNTSQFNITLLSSLAFKSPDINITIQFNVKDALSGALSGLGFLIFETLLGLGAGTGAALQGLGNGIAAMIMANGSQNTYINTNNFELINGSTQLQISTLGDAYPAYSSIMKYVSSIAPNQVPGQPEFISTLFYPGQICIRSISDPFPVVSTDPIIATSTIQQFGEWVPLTGLEPENIQADTVSTNFLSTGDLYANVGRVDSLEGFYAVYSNVGVYSNLSMNYQAPIDFTIGSGVNAAIVGNLQNLYMYTPGIVYTNTSLTGEQASMYLGTAPNESLLNISSIFSRGNIQGNTGFFSTLQVEQLIVISSLSTLYTQSNVTNISTANVFADFVGAAVGQFSSLSVSSINPFQFNSQLGNPQGLYDINRIDFVVSTTYDQVSSLQQNILSYSLNSQIQDEALLNIGDAPLGVVYKVTPQNIGQWASTIIYWSGLNPGGVDFGWVGQWGVSPGALGGAAPNGATLDIWIDPNNANGGTGPFYITEQSNTAYPAGVSTFFQVVPDEGQLNPNTYKFRATLPPIIGGSRSGWWEITNGFTPYQTSNNNTFQIFQDINDTYITASDRLHLQAGDIYLDGQLSLTDFNTVNMNVINLDATLGFVSTLNTTLGNFSTITANQITVNPVTGGLNTYYDKPSTLSFNAQPTQVNPLSMSFIVNSPDYIPIYTLVPQFMGSNQFTSYNQSSWNNTIWNNTTALSIGMPTVYLGDVQTTLGSYSAQFWIANNQVATTYALPIYVITSAGSNLLGNIPGGNYGLIQTTNGQTWTLNSNVPNPQGVTVATYSNILDVNQTASVTQIVDSQNIQVQAPNVQVLTGSMNLYADQIRVNSRRYGALQSIGLPSFPIGIENTLKINSPLYWSFVGGAYDWEVVSNYPVYNVNDKILYDANSWIIQVIPSRLRTNKFYVLEWDVQPAIFTVSGGGYCWGVSQYFCINTTLGGPGSSTDNYNWIIAFPKNYCTYV